MLCFEKFVELNFLMLLGRNLFKVNLEHIVLYSVFSIAGKTAVYRPPAKVQNFYVNRFLSMSRVEYEYTRIF